MAEGIQEKIMPLRQTKQLLGLAEKSALGCAFGITKDKKECVLFIQKTGGGKKCVKKIKAEGGSDIDVGSIRFGRVEIKPEDPGTVAFTVNRSESGGTVMTLNRLIKKAGYQGIVINADEALENEAEDDESGDAPPAPPPPAAAEAAPDPAALKARLTELVKRIPGVIATDPARKDGLLDLAKKSQIQLATNNLRTATGLVDRLEQLLDAPAGGSGGAADAKTSPAVLAKSRLAFDMASKRVVADLAKLRSALASHYGDGPSSAILSAFDQRVAPVLEVFDDKLPAKLDDLINATDGAERQSLVAECRKMIESGTSIVEGGTFIDDLDKNPFVGINVRAVMAPTLTALSTAVR